MSRRPSPPSDPELQGSPTGPAASCGAAASRVSETAVAASSPVHEELEPLVERMRPSLGRILGGYGIPPHEADDILQEVFLAALRKWELIRDKERWMTGVLRKRCAVFWRRRRTDLLEAVDAAILDLLSRPQPAPQERAVLVWDLESAFSTLPARHRAILWLRFGLGLSSDEVADQLGYSPASIRKLIARSLDRLRGAVAESVPSAVRPAAAPSLPAGAAELAARAALLAATGEPRKLKQERRSQPS
jgi:RNA polymerase sigma-70 factor (ECF subfamily)